MTDVSRQTAWRRANPQKAEVQSERSAAQRRDRVNQDEEYARLVRERARRSSAERQRRRAEGGPNGWMVIVRMADEKRGKPIVDIINTEDGRIRGLKRKQRADEKPYAWETREEAQAMADLLMKTFPGRVQSAREDVA